MLTLHTPYLLNGHCDLVFRDALGVGHRAAVLVDQVDEFLRHAAGAVHDQRQAGAGLHDLLDAVERELRLVLELVSAVAGADGDGQAVDAGALPEVGRLLRIGQELLDVLLIFLGVEADDVFLDPAEHPQFRLDDHARRVGELHRLGGELGRSSS